MSKRNREKRRLRKEQHRPAPAGRRVAEAVAFLKNFEAQGRIPEPATWPGACEPSLSRPDLIKLDLSTFAIDTEPGRGKFRQLERDLCNGLLEGCPDLDHWAIEEFLWHGLPGDSWHPIDAFLAREPERFSPEACAQLRLWKEARLGLFEIGAVVGDLVVFREWDALAEQPSGPDFRAISLAIGGVHAYRAHQGQIQLGYVAPWAPAEEIFCAMGYGPMMPPEIAPMFVPLFGLRTPEVVVRRLPWKISETARRQHAELWRQRSWHDWLSERLEFPFEAVIFLPEKEPRVYQAISLLPSTPEEARDFGIYLEVDLEGEPGAIGATALIPCDPGSANALPLAEYCAYRKMAGPPPAVRYLGDF
jgi:hypothetical protein